MNAIGYINQHEYEPRFWNMARCRSGQGDHPSVGYNTANGTYALPAAFGQKLEQALSQESLFRGMATVIRAYGNDYTLYAKDTNDLAQFVEEGGPIPVYDGIDDFAVSKIGSHELAVFVKLDEDFINDAGFSMEDYLTDRLGRNFGRPRTRASSPAAVSMNPSVSFTPMQEPRSALLPGALPTMMSSTCTFL